MTTILNEYRLEGKILINKDIREKILIKNIVYISIIGSFIYKLY